MRQFTVIWMMVAILFVSYSNLMADRCKIPVPPCPDGDNPDPGDDVSVDPVAQDGDQDIVDNDGEVPPPGELSATEMLDTYASLGGFFKEDLQQAVIGWNGREEVLILTTNEQSLVGQTAMLSVMPLPGKPVDIGQADKMAFARAKKLVLSKAAIPVGANSLGVFMERTIGSHNIFVWKMEEAEDFPKMVQAYLSRKYGGRAKALFTKKTLSVILAYHKRGFKYFAFDLALANKEKSTREAIAYHFNSAFCYYPLVISSAGGTGKTVVELVVFTKNELTKLSGISRDQITKVGEKTVSVGEQELSAIDPRLAELFAGDPSLTGRILLIPGKLEEFDKDFIAQ